MYYLVTFGGIHENFWQENLKTLGGIHETRQKKLKLFGRPAGPEGRSRALFVNTTKSHQIIHETQVTK